MKAKISPEDYRNILEALELDTLFLSELNTKFKEDFISQALKLDIAEKYSFVQENNILKIAYGYKLTAKDESLPDPAVSLLAKYTVRYQINKDVQITIEFMKVFSDLTLGMLLWTYFRELVNNSVYRMGLPPLVLPLKKR
jgi:hypothetical protein